MKKLPLALLILALSALFIFADYSVNLPDGIRSMGPAGAQATETETAETPPIEAAKNITQEILEGSELGSMYKIEKRTRSTELFELFDLSDLASIAIYKNILIDTGTAGQLPINIYEIHGPAGQGAITYLNIKLAMIDQLGSEEGINETGDYGFSSLFYNDSRNPSTGFMLSQIDDIVFGFRYNKKSRQAFDFIQSLVNNYMSQVTNNS